MRVQNRGVVRPEAPAVLLELPCAARMELDGDHLALELRRLAARRRAEIERALSRTRAHGEARELRAATLRPDQSGVELLLVDTLHVPGTGHVRVGRARDRSLLALVAPHDALGRLVLCAHQRERFLAAELAPPELGNP